MNSITVKAYGKVNLFLSVGAKRRDGMHDVETVICRVGIYDTVTVTEIAGDDIVLTTDSAELPVNSENIAYLAAESYFERAGKRHGISIGIEKRIPIKAGMGGGSSDAAAVLSALNGRYGYLNFDELVSVASKLGADVPFFLYDEDVMLGRGTGTELQRCGKLGFKSYGVFVMRGEKLSTGKAYAQLDEIKGGTEDAESSAAVINAIGEKDVSALADAIENDFECLYPVFKETEALLHSLGAKRSFLCGSGPTVCGIFENKEDADRALQKLFGEYAFLAEIGTDNN